MSGSNDQKVRVSTDRLGEVNNNNEGVFEKSNNGLDIKKSLVKMSNREGSTRSLSCFKNPEMSSKELPLSEEMTLDMYHTNFESNTGLKKKSKTFSSKSTDEKIQLSRLVKAKTEADDNFLNGKPMNGHCDTSPESSAIENLKSTMLESNEKNRNNQFRAATENFKAKLEENANKNPELKRADAVDNETKVDSMVKLSNLMKHREKVASISVQQNSEKIKEVPNQQKHGGQQVKQKVSNNVKQKTSESQENRRGHYDLRSQSKTSTKIPLVGPDSSQFLSNSSDEAGFDQKSVIKMKEQFDAVGVVKELKTKHVSNSTESSPKPKQALEMNKSPPVYEQWSENVEVSLCPKDEQTGESESKVSVGVNYSQGIRQISPQNEAQRIKVKSYQNESKHAAIDSNFKTSDSLLMNDNLSPDEFVVAEKIHKYNNDPSLKGKVSERKEFFSSLGRRLDSEFVARDWHASDRTTKPKHFEYFEDIERDRSHRNLRGRTEANRRKLDREDMPEDREIEDSRRSLKHLYAVHSERSGKQNHSYQKNHSFGNLNENGEHDYLQPKEHLYQNDKDWNVGHRFKDISGNVKTTGEENYIQTSRFTTRNLNGFNGDLSPVSDAPSDDKDSVGEYELQPKFGRSEIQVPSESAIQKMIEDDTRNDYIPQKSTKTPVGTSKSNSKMTSDFDNHKPNGYGFYEKINETSDDTADKGKQKFEKKPRGNGLNYGQIWYEEENKKHSDWAPTPPPVRTESGDEYNDNDSADYANDDELNDDDDDEETTIRTITKTITRQIKQTIPSGIVTIAQEGGKRNTENHRITGTITAKKNKPRQTLEKNLVSGFINVEKEISHQPIRTPSRKEHNIEVVTKNNPTPPPRESIRLSMFDARNATPLPSQAFLRHEGLTENYSERIMTTPLVETELGIDPELKDAKKTGSTYKITMNLTPSLLVSSRPASAVPNTNFISPPFSPSSFISQPNLISRHNSNISSDAHNTHYMNGTLSSVTPSVFSPPAQNAPFFHSNLSIHREQDRGSGSGTVVVSLTEASGNKKQVPTQSDVAFDISLQGIEGEPRPKNVSSLTVSNVKSSPRNEFSGRNIEEQVVKKDIMSSTLNDVPDNSRSNWKQTERNHLQRSAVALHGYSSRKLISAKPQEERNEVQFSKSGPREVSGDGGRSASRPEILYSALDATRAKDSQDAGRSVYDVGTISSKEQSCASQKIPECVVTNETPKWKQYLDYSRRNGEMTAMPETTGDHALTISYKNSLQSLDEDGQFDKEIEINKRHQSAFGTANVESYDTRRHASGGSSETWYGRRMEQINKFDLQTLLRGAAADSVKQRINIKRLGDKLSNGPQISPDLKHLLVRDELPPSENDKVAEEISMNIDNGKVTMTSEILCEKTVPIYNSQDMYKTSSVLLIRVIEVDLSVTPERKRLYDLIVGPNIEKRSLPENEKRELYKKFMALAEHSRKELM